jgi:hypothetical protein
MLSELDRELRAVGASGAPLDGVEAAISNLAAVNEDQRSASQS